MYPDTIRVVTRDYIDVDVCLYFCGPSACRLAPRADKKAQQKKQAMSIADDTIKRENTKQNRTEPEQGTSGNRPRHTHTQTQKTSCNCPCVVWLFSSIQLGAKQSELAKAEHLETEFTSISEVFFFYFVRLTSFRFEGWQDDRNECNETTTRTKKNEHL